MRIPFEQVVARHGPAVLRVCRAVAGPDDAQDAWSETFLSALRAYPDLPEDANVPAWLVTIAHRRAIDAHRARARRPVPVDRLPERPQPQVGLPVDERDRLYAALAALPRRQRLAVAYHHLGGLPHPEVAGIIGGTPQSVRRASADGIAALRRALDEDEEEQ